MNKEEVYKIARRVKEQIDNIVEEFGTDEHTDTLLDEVNNMQRWIRLKNKDPETILFAMEFYLDGLLRAMRRLKK